MKKYIGYIALCGWALLSLTSCDSFLDKLPDDRAEIDDEGKVVSLLVSAYPTVNNVLITEMSSDNMTDNGKSWSYSPLQDQLYRFKDVDDEGNDSPRSVWQGYYGAIATCNEALQDIALLPETATLKAAKAEALLCRAYSMFMLANTFCMAYNPEKADEYLGLPYPKEPEQGIDTKYERGTLAELYKNIDADIEEALPLVSDQNYKIPKYHFNIKAAYAFAARFNLYYMKYEKCIAYANMAIGEDPVSLLRDLSKYGQFGFDDISNLYINSSEPCNLMLIQSYSTAGLYFMPYPYNPRFSHNSSMCSYETVWANMPWGGGSDLNTLYYSTMLYGNSQRVAFPKLDPKFEYTDKINNVGFYHQVLPVFTADETVLCRAEAYAMLKQYDKALNDVNAWITTHCAPQKEYKDKVLERPVLTVNMVNEFMDEVEYSVVDPESSRERTIRKTLHPQGFKVEEGTQENVIQTILHVRRLETLHDGLRFYDLKRYGIEYAHTIAGENSAIFKAGDLRGAIQIPNDVVTAGITANPR